MKVRDRTQVEQSVEILNERLARVDQTDDALVRLWARSVNQVQVRCPYLQERGHAGRTIKGKVLMVPLAKRELTRESHQRFFK